MRHLIKTGLAVAAGALLAGGFAAPAEARLVYVKKAATAAPVVYAADDDGSSPRRIGVGRAPTVSPDGRWMAYVSLPQDGMETVTLVPLEGGVATRLVMRSKSVTSVRFTPDSGKVAAVLADRRVRVYDIATDTIVDALRGHIRGYAFAPDATAIVAGQATGRSRNASADLFVAPIGGGEARRLTTTGDAVNPVWGPTEIVYDRQRRRKGNVPAYNLWAVDPAGANAPRRLTRLKIPAAMSGLVPLEASADGSRLLAILTGTDVGVGFTVATADGETRALSRDLEGGVVGFDLSANGRRILAQTGGLDPAGAHDVVSVRYGGGRPKVLVRRAAFPDWSA